MLDLLHIYICFHLSYRVENMFVCIYIYISVYICLYLYLYICIQICTQRQRRLRHSFFVRVPSTSEFCRAFFVIKQIVSGLEVTLQFLTQIS